MDGLRKGKEMNINEIFDHCLKLTMSKRHDYTSTIDNHENFKRSAQLGEWFKNSNDKPYVILIGVKLARLASLLDAKQPKHESIEDSFLDLINYCALWMERRTIESFPTNQFARCVKCGVTIMTEDQLKNHICNAF